MLVAGVVVVGVEGVVVEVEVDVLVEDGVVVVVVVEVAVDVDVDAVGLVPGVVEAVWQSCLASAPTVLSPSRRLVRSVGLTLGGRLVTVWANAATAREASPQFPDATAEETASSWLFRLAA